MISLWLGCAQMPQDASRIDALQVVAVTAEPPHAPPGGLVALEVLVADPLDAGYDLWQWACFGESCFEVGDTLVVPPTLPPSDEGLPILVWTLACEPGLCPEPTYVADPTGALEELPFEGVALHSRFVFASTRERANPTVDCSAEGDDYTCLVDGEFGDTSVLRPWTTDGAWGVDTLDLGPGDTEARITLFPDEGDPQLYVVVSDGEGGLGVWTN